MGARRLSQALMSSEESRWGTPEDFYRWVDAAIGHFTLDVCAEPHTAKCKRYFTEADDGLSQSWAGELAWMNPPFGDQHPRWLTKMRREVLGDAAGGGCLVPSRVDAGWWADATAGVGRLRSSYYVPESRTWWCRWAGLIVGIYHHDARLKYVGMKDAGGAPFPSSVIVLAKPGHSIRPDLKSKYALLGGRQPITLGMPR